MGLFSFNWGLPPNVSTTGDRVDILIVVLHWFMLALFLGWGAFFAWCLVRFRARPGHKAIYEPIHASWSKWLEIGVAIFEGILLVGFSMPVWASFKDVEPHRNDPNAIQIKIVAQQFAWNFHYPGLDGKFGKTDVKFVDDSNPVGIDPDDPNGKDDIVTTNQLYLPWDHAVVADVTSKDVIHSFGVPVLRIRQDAIPGMLVPIWFQLDQQKVLAAESVYSGYYPAAKDRLDAANAALDEVKSLPDADPGKQRAVGNQAAAQGDLDAIDQQARGNFDIACSQLCGIGHGKMRAVLHVLDDAGYKAWETQEEIDAGVLPQPAVTGSNGAATPSASPAASPAATPAAATPAAATPAATTTGATK